MSRRSKKENVEGESLEHGGDKPGGDERPPVLVGRIQSEEQARALVKTLYTVPEGNRLVLVTEDRNVFWKDSEGSAVNHAQKHNLKLFRLQWD